MCFLVVYLRERNLHSYTLFVVKLKNLIKLDFNLLKNTTLDNFDV